MKKKTVLLMGNLLAQWEYLREIGDIHHFMHTRPLDIEIFEEKIRIIKPHCVVCSLVPFNGDIMDVDERLEWIFTLTQGYDHIDIDAATERGILVSNCGGTPETSHAVSELAWAHILAVLRRIPQADAETRTGELMKPERWGGTKNKDDLMFYRGGPLLWGKTLGLIGLGKTGSRAAITGRLGFNMKVIAFDPYISQEKADMLNVELVDLDTLCKESDVISIHAILTDETKGLIGEREFKLMKPTAIIVNTARGAIIDMQALAEVLEEGRIGGAGIDVWQEEPPHPNEWWVKSLQKSNRTCLTHHIGNVYESLVARHRDAIKNIERFCTGKDPLWVVNPIVIWKKRIGEA